VPHTAELGSIIDTPAHTTLCTLVTRNSFAMNYIDRAFAGVENNPIGGLPHCSAHYLFRNSPPWAHKTTVAK